MIWNAFTMSTATTNAFCGSAAVLEFSQPLSFIPAGCTRHARTPQHYSENILNREFHAEKPNEKWLTDVTEFKYYEGPRVKKVYLSAILDLYDRRIVSFVIRDTNDNKLVFDTFAKAVQNNPDAHPIFHSDRGFQYTNRYFYQRLVNAV